MEQNMCQIGTNNISNIFLCVLWTEMIAQLNRQMPSNINRERRTPYQHPKGAPDADVIFGSKYTSQ